MLDLGCALGIMFIFLLGVGTGLILHFVKG
jgi:hypothetical protein